MYTASTFQGFFVLSPAGDRSGEFVSSFQGSCLGYIHSKALAQRGDLKGDFSESSHQLARNEVRVRCIQSKPFRRSAVNPRITCTQSVWNIGFMVDVFSNRLMFFSCVFLFFSADSKLFSPLRM
jgi:hypothetical protein